MDFRKLSGPRDYFSERAEAVLKQTRSLAVFTRSMRATRAMNAGYRMEWLLSRTHRTESGRGG